MQPLRPVVVCADDYALTPGISRGIRELIAARRISATSVMTVSEFWPLEAPALRQAVATTGADIGLHLTLTEQRPIGRLPVLAPDGHLPSVGNLIGMSLTRRLPLVEIEREIERQIEGFLAVWGGPPAHIDGHHHTHQLPGIRDCLLRIAAQLNPRPYLRVCHEPLGRIIARRIAAPKAIVISNLGAGFARRARAAGFDTNDGFSGVYDLAGPAVDIEATFSAFVTHTGARPIVMCHPGYVDAELAGRDPVSAPRADERAFLGGPAWLDVLRKAGVAVAPFAAMQCPD